jgi:hypothetical protein
MKFTPNRVFRRKYNAVFRKDPMAANTLLLLAELADQEGRVVIAEPAEETLAILMSRRFKDPRARQL